MPNFIINFFNHFSLYVSGFQIVRDECEKVRRLKLQRMNKWFSRVSREKLTCEKATCRAHDWKMKSHARLEIFMSKANSKRTRETLCLAKSEILLYQVFTHTIYTFIIHKL